MKARLAAVPWRWIGLGVAAYLIFLVATLPATFVTRRLTAQGLVLSGVSGSIWNGRANASQLNGLTFTSLRWQVRPASLLLGRLSLDMQATRDDGYINGRVSLRTGQRIDIADLRMALPIHALRGFAGALAANWQGTLQAQFAELSLERGWPRRARGSIDAQNLSGPARQPTAIGGYRVTFDSADKTSNGDLSGQVASQDDAPVDVAGVLRIQANRQYFIEAQIGTRANTPASILQALQYLGPPNPQGRRTFSLSGSF